MMDVLAWVGAVTGTLALVFALIALFRPVPPIGFERLEDVPDSWVVWNTGPAMVKIVDVYFESFDGRYTIEEAGATAHWDVADERFRAGRTMPVGRRYFFRVDVNTNLVIHYRTAGPFGVLSRGKVSIEGDV